MRRAFLTNIGPILFMVGGLLFIGGSLAMFMAADDPTQLKVITAEKIILKHPEGKSSIEMAATKNWTGISIRGPKGQEQINIQYDAQTKGCALFLYGPESGMPRLVIANTSDGTIFQVCDDGKPDSTRFVKVGDIVTKVKKP